MIVVQHTGDDIIVTTGEILSILGTTRKTLTKWTQAGCPGRIDYGKWSLAKTLQWRWPPEQAESELEKKDLEFRKLQADVEFRENRLARIRKENEILADQYYKKSDVEEAWQWRVESLEKALEGFVKDVVATIRESAKKDIPGLEDIVEKSVRGFLTNYARGDGTDIDE